MTDHYSFELVNFEITNTRSRHEDTDYTSFSLLIKDKNWKKDGAHSEDYKPKTKTKSNGNVNNGVHPLGLIFDNVAIEPADTIEMNYLIVNNGHEKPGSVLTDLEKTGTNLAEEGAEAAGTAAGAAIGSAIPIPGIGTALGALAGFLVGKLGGLLFADCDGAVAAERVALSAEELKKRVHEHHGNYEVKTFHPGTNSPDGCGSNSKYYVTWAIRRR